MRIRNGGIVARTFSVAAWSVLEAALRRKGSPEAPGTGSIRLRFEEVIIEVAGSRRS